MSALLVAIAVAAVTNGCASDPVNLGSGTSKPGRDLYATLPPASSTPMTASSDDPTVPGGGELPPESGGSSGGDGSGSGSGGGSEGGSGGAGSGGAGSGGAGTGTPDSEAGGTTTTTTKTTTTTTTSTEQVTSFGPVTTVTDSTFSSQVLNSADPVLVAFQKPTCVDCINFDPVLSDVAAEQPIRVFTLDASQNPETPESVGVITPPCPDCGTFISPLVVVFKNGDVAEKIKIKKPDGSLLTKQELTAKLAPHLG